MMMNTITSEEEICLTDEEDNTKSPLIRETVEENVSVDVYVKHIGEYGRYQNLILLLLSLACIPLTYPALIFYYIGYSPMWKCNNGTDIHDMEQACINNTEVLEHTNTARCQMNRTSWTFENTTKSTMVTEFDLVCNRSWLNSLSGSVVFMGWGIGIVVMGYLSDQYGRKKVMFPCLAIALTCLLSHAFFYNVRLLIILRFFMGFFYSAPELNKFVLVMELVGTKYRVIATSLFSFVWPLGAILLTLKAYYINDWRMLCIACSAPYLLGILTAICIPESVRWLYMKGHKKKAEDILRRAAQINKKKLPAFLSLAKQEERKQSTEASYLDLFKRRHLLKLVLLQTFIWFHSGMTYYAMSWEFADIGGDMYTNFIYSSLVEVPAAIIVMLTVQRFGRKKMSILFCVITSLCCMGVACTHKTSSFKLLRLSLGLIGKCTMTMGFHCLYLWSSEIFSTVVRTQGMAINVVTSRVGAACSPFIQLLNTFHPEGSFILMTITSINAAMLCCMLPETLNKPTRERLEDMIPTAQTKTLEMLVLDATNDSYSQDEKPTNTYTNLYKNDGGHDNDLL